MVGTSIKKGFSVTGKSLGLMTVLFVFGLVWNLINVFYAEDLAQTEATTPQSILVLALGVVFILLSIFLQAGSLAYILDVIKQGKGSLSGFIAGGKKYYVRLFLLGFIVSAVLILIFAVIMFSASALLDTMLPLAVTLTAFLGTALLCFVVLVFLAPYIIVVENEKTIASIKRSISAVRNRLGPLLILSLLLILIGFGVGLLLGGIQAGISLVLKQEAALKIIVSVLGSLANACLGMLVTATFMSFYLSGQVSNTNNN